MRVLVLAPHPFYQVRGTPIAEEALLQVLSHRGCEVDVLTFHEGGSVVIPGCRICRIPRLPGVRGIGPGFSFKKLLCDAVMATWCLARVASRRYDLVHAVEESVFMAAVVRFLFGIPYVYDMDSSLPRQMLEKYPRLAPVRRLMQATEALAVGKSLAVVAVCRALQETAARYAPGKPVCRVEDFSLLSEGDTGSGERLADTIGRPGPIVLYVGNLEPYQGIDLLLAGFVRCLAQVPEAQLVLIGGDPRHVTAYCRLAESMGIRASAHFLGPRPLSLLTGYLHQASVVVSPRVTGQNTPMKIYSYLDSGRPLVATRLLMHTQVLDDEIALLVEPDPASMGDGLARLLRDGDTASRLARAAQERVRREFSRDAFERKMNAFYDLVERELNARRGGRS